MSIFSRYLSSVLFSYNSYIFNSDYSGDVITGKGLFYDGRLIVKVDFFSRYLCSYYRNVYGSASYSLSVFPQYSSRTIYVGQDEARANDIASEVEVCNESSFSLKYAWYFPDNFDLSSKFFSAGFLVSNYDYYNDMVAVPLSKTLRKVSIGSDSDGYYYVHIFEADLVFVKTYKKSYSRLPISVFLCSDLGFESLKSIERLI